MHPSSSQNAENLFSDEGQSAASAADEGRTTSNDLLCDPTVASIDSERTAGGSARDSTDNSVQKRKLDCSENTHSHVYMYGNYHRYYGYRDPNFANDRRIDLFEHDWFKSRRVLDIGCNEGNVTLQIATQLNPSKIVGVDIDATLVAKAKRNIDRFSHAQRLNGAKRRRLFNTVHFFTQNYVLDNDDQLQSVRAEYDTILALSVTKWFHLNFGDDGLKRAFRRVFLQLSDGGIFILEPQPFSSYKKYKRLSAATAKNYEEIRFKPDQFRDYLLSREIGFVSCRKLESVATTNKHKGFCRPIFLFQKAESTTKSELAAEAEAKSKPSDVNSLTI